MGEARRKRWPTQRDFASVWLPGVGRNSSTTAWTTGCLADTEEEMGRHDFFRKLTFCRARRVSGLSYSGLTCRASRPLAVTYTSLPPGGNSM